MHPHFLFNTLNNPYSLALEKSDKTPDLIIRLGDMLSYIIYDCNSDKVLLVKEIDFLKSYIELQKVRYVSCDIKLEITGDIDNQKIAPMLLHTFLDNSFKHGAATYREYAIDGYDLDVIDFLLKPISFERFLKAINRYCNRTNPFHKNSNGQVNTSETKHVFIQDGKNIYKIPYADLLYLEGFGEYVKVVTVSKTHLVRDSLSVFEQKLPAGHFLRIHKSYIVNLEKITGYSSVHVMLKNIELPIGRIYREKVLEMLRKGSSG